MYLFFHVIKKNSILDHLLEKEMKGGANHANLMRQKSKKEFS